MKTTFTIRDNLMQWIISRSKVEKQDVDELVNDLLERGIEQRGKLDALPPLIKPKHGEYFPTVDLKSRIEEGRD